MEKSVAQTFSFSFAFSGALSKILITSDKPLIKNI
jgi:hypothetical protein